MKKTILLISLLGLSLSTWAFDFEVNGIYYDIISSISPYKVAVTVETNNANSYSGDVTIPLSVTYNSINYSVTRIESYAFASSSGLTSVTIPSSVTSIKAWAFMSCYELSTLVIPSSVDSIGDGAFWGCIKIANIAIPASVKKIGSYVFFGCKLLTQINADAANNYYSSVDGILYNKDKSTLLVYPAGKPETTYTISTSVDTIGDMAFSDCQNLYSITIPTSVVYITGHAFTQCNSLTSMYIPASVTFFNNNPFYDCAGMTAVTVDPANIDNESVDGVLFNKELTTIIYYPPAKVGSSYVIPSTVDYVRSSAFMNCLNLTSVTIPESVKTIRSGMFMGCTNMTSINAYPTVPVDLTSTNSDSNDVFKGINTTTCVLHVPIGSKNLYAAAFQWMDFTNIVEGFSSGLTYSTASNLQVNVQEGVIQVSGGISGKKLEVYTLLGKLIYSQKIDATFISFRLPTHGIYVLQIGTENVKLVY